ncbi:MAG: hypothetical protein JWM50_657 [Microbacteriaceae bacterium]|jgi:uncharacterized CHY-type Zn-finger protein|nr:hypothetical protein [Microbacteriaceae bacterium]
MIVHGSSVDDQTRCIHYASALDIIAIRFTCCGRYYSCYSCHTEEETHPAQPWPAEAFDERAVLCGVCRFELTISDYLGVDTCPSCAAPFNPNCALHHHLYFTIS